MPTGSLPDLSLAKSRFRHALAPDRLEAVGRATKFVQRLRTVTAGSVFFALVVRLGAHKTQYLSDVLRTLNAQQGWDLRYKPFWNRLAKAAFPRFMKAMFEALVRELAATVLRAQDKTVASLFTCILVDDGSAVALADGLAKVFPGRFNTITPAGVEVHGHLSLTDGQMKRVSIAPDKEGERHFLPETASLPKGSLSLRDRGYIDLDGFRAFNSRGAFLICRAAEVVNPIVDRIRNLPRKVARKWEGRHLKDLPESLRQRGLDMDVTWPLRSKGRPHIQLRLVLRYNRYRVSKERVGLKKQQRAKQNRWKYLVTNIMDERVDGNAIESLYKLRWQIELAFKEWKSYANLHGLQTEHPAIAEGLIWASLCAALLKRALGHWAQFVHRCPISERLAAQSGPDLLPTLAAWVAGALPDASFSGILQYLSVNARRAHPRRDERRPQHTLGWRYATLDGFL